MNIKKFGKRLGKINMLFDSIKDDGDVSAMEKDLLLSYLREAYEYVLDGKQSQVFPTEIAAPRTYEAPVKKEVVQQASPQPSQDMMASIASAEVTQPAVQVSESHTTPTVVESVATPVIDLKEETTEELPSSLPMSDVPDELAEIFDSALGNDLGDKLSMSPIKDMTKAMGINEKIFTVKELFGGDGDMFKTIMERINELDTYEAAKAYLATGIAKDQNWAAPDRLKKADKFIKLVKRRFA